MATAPLVCNRDRDRIIAAAQEVCGLTDDEVIIYAALFDAAERGLPCPVSDDLNDLTDRSSTSASSTIMRRLAERKGLIVRDISNQRFRRVQIVATGKWTAPSEDMRSIGNHMPRGTHDPKPLTKAMADVGNAAQAVDEVVHTLRGLLRFESAVDRLKELIVRRKMHFLITPGDV